MNATSCDDSLSAAEEADPPGLAPLAAAPLSPLRFRWPAASAETRATYGRVFWWCYLSNLSTMIAISLLFRYGDFVAFLGGKEGQLGLIVGVGMVGSLMMRLVQGVAIDRYGSRRIWILSQVGMILALLGHLAIASSSAAPIFALRALFSTSVAGIFGASVTFVSRRAPANRVAEVIGSLGTSGFVAMMLGPLFGDWICRSGAVGRREINTLFLAAAAMGAVSLIAAFAATAGGGRQARRRVPPVLQVLRRYHPGAIMLAAVAMGVGIGMPHTFLRTYAAHLHLPRIGAFFAVYAVTAFLARLATTRLPERAGVRPMIVAGLSCLAISMLLYLPVHANWQFAFPAMMAGVAHALLFPAIVGGGSTSFPERYRGVGTTLMMGMFDLGVFVGAPTIGGVIHAAKQLGLPSYATMFTILSLLMAAVAGVYFWKSAPPSSARPPLSPLANPRGPSARGSDVAGTAVRR